LDVWTQQQFLYNATGNTVGYTGTKIYSNSELYLFNSVLNFIVKNVHVFC